MCACLPTIQRRGYYRAAERLISRTIEKSGIRTVERITELHGEKGKIRKNVRLTAGFRKFFDT
jgi:hypothetical protein